MFFCQGVKLAYCWIFCILNLLGWVVKAPWSHYLFRHAKNMPNEFYLDFSCIKDDFGVLFRRLLSALWYARSQLDCNCWHVLKIGAKGVLENSFSENFAKVFLNKSWEELKNIKKQFGNWYFLEIFSKYLKELNTCEKQSQLAKAFTQIIRRYHNCFKWRKYQELLSWF